MGLSILHRFLPLVHPPFISSQVIRQEGGIGLPRRTNHGNVGAGTSNPTTSAVSIADDSSITDLFERVRRIPVPTPPEQLRLARLVRTWLDWPPADGPCPPSIQRRGVRAKQRLVEGNLRLVASVVGRYRHVWRDNPGHWQDLFQDGVVGLGRAIEKFEPTKGYAFSTYAFWWISQSIGKTCDNLTSPIRVPQEAATQWAKLSRIISQYEQQYGRRPTIEWLSEFTELSRSKIERYCIVGRIKLVASLDAPAMVGDKDASALVDLISYEDPGDENESIEAGERIALLHRMMAKLSEADRSLIFALDVQGATQIEVASITGVSRSAVGQRHKRALGRLKELVEEHQAVAA